MIKLLFFSRTKKFIQLKADFSKSDLFHSQDLLHGIFQFQNKRFSKTTIKNFKVNPRFHLN